MLRPLVYGVDVQSIDFSDAVLERTQSRLDRAPVIFRHPVSGQLLHRGKLHTLGVISNGFPVGVSGRDDAPAEINEFLIRSTECERANCGFGSRHLRISLVLLPNAWENPHLSD